MRRPTRGVTLAGAFLGVALLGSGEAAAEAMRRESGETLDQKCVTALERVLAREQADRLAVAV